MACDIGYVITYAEEMQRTKVVTCGITALKVLGLMLRSTCLIRHVYIENNYPAAIKITSNTGLQAGL